MNFDFISDEKLRRILERDFKELKICQENKAFKSVLILAGSIVEAVLVDYLSVSLGEKIKVQELLRKDLFQLIQLGINHELISKQTEGLSTVVRNYRNLIHPGKEKRTGQKFDSNTSSVAVNLLNIIIEDIQESYKKTFIYSAKDIYDKLCKDPVDQDIFEAFLDKVHEHERNKLYNMLIDIDYEISMMNDIEVVSEPKKYTQVLKHHISEEPIINQIKKLIKEVEIGTSLDVMRRYYILFDELDLVNHQEITIVVHYVISFLKQKCNDSAAISEYCYWGIYSSLSKYFSQPNFRKSLYLLVGLIVMYSHRSQQIYKNCYDQLMSSVSSEQENEIKLHIEKTVGTTTFKAFLEYQESEDDLPF